MRALLSSELIIAREITAAPRVDRGRDGSRDTLLPRSLPLPLLLLLSLALLHDGVQRKGPYIAYAIALAA